MKKHPQYSKLKKIRHVSAYAATGAAALAITDSAQAVVVSGFSGMVVQATDTNTADSTGVWNYSALIIPGFGSISITAYALNMNNPFSLRVGAASLGYSGNLNVGATPTYTSTGGYVFYQALSPPVSNNVTGGGLYLGGPALLNFAFATSGGPIGANSTFRVPLQNAAGNLGWVELQWVATDAPNVSSVITVGNWAFETVPGVAIHIPEPSSAAMLLLAAGAAGLRRQRKLHTKAINAKEKTA